jgi:hypothetical protein
MKPTISSIIGGTRRELLAMPWEEYLAYPGLNCSTIKQGEKSMLHLKHQWDSDGKSTDAMLFGRLLHCMLFEPGEVVARYWPWKGVRRGKAYDEWRFRAGVAGAELVRDEGAYSLEIATEAAQGFLRNSRVKELIAAGQAEQTVLAVEGDIQCKGRLDWVSTSEHVLTDLKTTAAIEPGLFGKTFFNFGYDISLGTYRRWLNSVTGDRWPVEVIVLESKPPYDVAVIPVPDAVLDAGADKAMALIAKVRHAIEVDEWPGIAQDQPMPLVIPYYVMRENEDNELQVEWDSDND